MLNLVPTDRSYIQKVVPLSQGGLKRSQPDLRNEGEEFFSYV